MPRLKKRQARLRPNRRALSRQSAREVDILMIPNTKPVRPAQAAGQLLFFLEIDVTTWCMRFAADDVEPVRLDIHNHGPTPGFYATSHFALVFGSNLDRAGLFDKLHDNCVKLSVCAEFPLPPTAQLTPGARREHQLEAR